MAPRKKATNTSTISQELLHDSVQEGKENIVSFINSPASRHHVVPEIEITLKEARKRIDILKKFIDELMIPGIDYGIVPGVGKPTLLKAGAEKLCDAFGFAKKVEVTNRYEDWHRGLFHYEIKVVLVCKRSGVIEAEGIGSCNSKETAYKDQCGHNIANTVIKMAKKRAFIDATLTAIRGSDAFTQDVEQMDWLSNKNSKETPLTSLPATRKQLSFIFSLVEQRQLPIDEIKTLMNERYSVSESKRLSIQQASDFIDYLKELNQLEENVNKKLPTICK